MLTRAATTNNTRPNTAGIQRLGSTVTTTPSMNNTDNHNGAQIERGIDSADDEASAGCAETACEQPTCMENAVETVATELVIVGVAMV